MGRTGPPPAPIDSPANDRLKLVRGLRRARDRRREGLFVVEGYRELERLVAGVPGAGGPRVVELLAAGIVLFDAVRARSSARPADPTRDGPHR